MDIEKINEVVALLEQAYEKLEEVKEKMLEIGIKLTD